MARAISCAVLALPAGSLWAAEAQGPKVSVVLFEWSISPKPRTIEAGTVRIVARNIGSETHELLIVAAQYLPLESDGSINESAISSRRVGRISTVKSQKSKVRSFQLEPGTYLLLCNIVGETSHFSEGMVATLEVGVAKVEAPR